jgi:hypothetical protein
MSDTRKRAQWIGGACLLVALALVAVRAPWAGAEPAASADAPSCGAGSKGSVDAQVQTLMSETMRDLSQQQAAGAADDSGWVVLNNRGYNYGPAPGPQFDALFGDVAANPNGDAR